MSFDDIAGQTTSASANSLLAYNTLFGRNLFTMVLADMDIPVRSSLARSLKDATQSTHQRLDKAIMDHEPFSSRERYRLFLKVQHAFHREIGPLYGDVGICALLPSIAGGSRLEAIELDLNDLGVGRPAYAAPPLFEASAAVHLPAALGWLYVAEGSNLGAAFLFKEAEKLGLTDTFGAGHLAAAPQGRGLQWKTFKSELDTIELVDRHKDGVILGASAAFDHVRALLTHIFR